MRTFGITLAACSLCACAFSLDYDALLGGPDASSAADAGESGAPSGDATADVLLALDGAPLSFCATRSVKLCDDFDGERLGDWVVLDAGGPIEQTTTSAVSPPKALRITVNAGSNAKTRLRKDFPASERPRLGASFRLEAPHTTNDLILLATEIAVDPPTYEYVQAIIGVTATNEVFFSAQWKTLSGQQGGDAYALGTSPFEWHRYEIEIDTTTKQARAIVDGAPRGPVAWPFEAAPMYSEVGTYYFDPAPSSPLVVLYDDAIVDW